MSLNLNVRKRRNVMLKKKRDAEEAKELKEEVNELKEQAEKLKEELDGV